MKHYKKILGSNITDQGFFMPKDKFILYSYDESGGQVQTRFLSP